MAADLIVRKEVLVNRLSCGKLQIPTSIREAGNMTGKSEGIIFCLA